VYDSDHIWLCFDGNNTLTNRYLYGPTIDMALADERSTTAVRWMLTDNQGTVRDITNNVGAVQNHIRYDSFGRITSQTNASFSTRFNYTGREFDAETGLYYYRSRYYDPGVGRFIGEDAIGFAGGDVNLYRYVGNSPNNFFDPFGFLTIVIPGGGGEVGILQQNISKIANYSIVSLGGFSPPGFGIKKNVEIAINQIFDVLKAGLEPGEPIVIIAHSDGNRLVPSIINTIRGLQGIPLRPKKGVKPTGCINPKDPNSLIIQVGRLDPTGLFKKPSGANLVVDVGSSVPGDARTWASQLLVFPDFRVKADHDGLLYDETVIRTLKFRYQFGF
jgi:RHS repeat-associated protein